MTEAVVAFTDWLDAHFDFVRLEAPVYAWNPASARVLEKAGYTCEAVQAKRVLKDETLVDQWLYVKLR
jgi:RimJ/RimL family protein N-acetyltransferase